MNSLIRADEQRVLTLNVGSSSVKFAVYRAADAGDALLTGTVDHGNRAEWLDRVLEQTAAVAKPDAWAGIGHRLVHGGPTFFEPVVIGPKIISSLKELVPFAPEHLPGEIALIEQVAQRLPDVPQVACFDTAFHRDLPRVAQLLPIPRRYAARGLRRYGFHGLSYEFLGGELQRLGDPAIRKGRVILAHLGNGASLAAVRDGACIDTTMAFTPAAGLVMGSRTGDLDPGVLIYLAKHDHLDPEQLNRLVNHESGLLAISETTSDMRKLLAQESTDVRSAEAVALFCQQTKKYLGAFAAALGGVDTLVFSGGIGEHNASIRERICSGLEFLGIALDAANNEAHAPVISSAESRVRVRVIPTNEEIVIARAVHRLIKR